MVCLHFLDTLENRVFTRKINRFEGDNGYRSRKKCKQTHVLIVVFVLKSLITWS